MTAPIWVKGQSDDSSMLPGTSILIAGHLGAKYYLVKCINNERRY